ncbi:MAG: hypothetical protein GX672_05715 [Synergistaceae bacterium]|nr:hypothetical protein [Synergistaceae bacterium]
MKRKFLFLLIFLLTFNLFACPTSFRAEASQSEFKSLLDERQIDCWVEGEIFGDLILGSRGTIQFIYLDAKLSKAISAEQGLSPWVDDLNQYFGSSETKKKVLFIANLEANKPWTVEEKKISVGGYHLTKKDVVSSSWKNPFGTVDAGTSWQFAFVVPQDKVKPGTDIMVGYGDDLIKWKVPK